MKPQSLQTQSRCRQRQQNALEAIELAHEKDGREFGYQHFGGPILSESDALQQYDQMLAGTLGKLEPSQLRAGRKWER